MDFELVDAPINTAALRARLLASGAGGFASFEGWVRDHHEGRAVRGLAYSSYRALAQAEGERILADARARTRRRGNPTPGGSLRRSARRQQPRRSPPLPPHPSASPRANPCRCATPTTGTPWSRPAA